MESFSQRKSITPIKSKIQSECMDDDLRTALWNLLQSSYFSELYTRHGGIYDERNLDLCMRIWTGYFSCLLDEADTDILRNEIRDHFLQCEWYEVYNFMEFVVGNYSDDWTNAQFMERCNDLLERHLSAYRFINGMITPVVEEEQVSAIEQALQSPSLLIREHLEQAQKMLLDREEPDYRNSIKESISAVECLCKLITGDKKSTLGKALQRIEGKSGIQLHRTLRDAFCKLYGYTSDANGIRHALTEASNLDLEDAIFMLVACSAFTNYLIAKASEAGIHLQ